MKNEFNISDIENATLEAIYWWNRTEQYYHYYFSRLNVIYSKKNMLSFFTAKVFEVFLREYAIRRNISKGSKSVDYFIEDMMNLKFYENVKQGNKFIVDEVSRRIKKRSVSTTKETKSLLSKVAFLINPKDFSLYDTFAKKSILTLYKIKESNINNYDKFIALVDDLINKLKEDKFSEITDNILQKFKITEAYSFFSRNREAFQRRIFDKYLWINYYNKINQDRSIDNSVYFEFISL